MFTDDFNCNYVYLDSLKRIVWECPKDQKIHPDLSVELRPALLPLFQRLIRERPTWKFKSKQSVVFTTTTKLELTKFFIYDGDEEIGTVWAERHWRDSANRFYFHNPRVEASRVTRGNAYSTKVDVAAKRILSAFYTKTAAERASEAFGQLRTVIVKTYQSAHYSKEKSRSEVERIASDYALRDWDGLVALCGPAMAETNLPYVTERFAEASQLQNVLSQNLGTVVQRNRDGSYLLARPFLNGGYDLQTCTDATLPSYVLGPLGLLKLVEGGTFIPNVGIRASKGDLFFIMAQPEESSDG